MTAAELADVPLVELCAGMCAELGCGTVGVRARRRWTVYVPGCRPGHGTTYLEAFADALRRAQGN